MRQSFTIAFFFFLVFQASAQKVENIIGEYVFEEKIGLHSDGVPSTIGNRTYLSRPLIADTTIRHKLCLNDAHAVFLERDTSFNAIYFSGFDYEWIGNWQLKEDSLIVTLDRLIITYAFTMKDFPSRVVEQLAYPVVMTYKLDETFERIYLVDPKKGELIDFEKLAYK